MIKSNYSVLQASSSRTKKKGNLCEYLHIQYMQSIKITVEHTEKVVYLVLAPFSLRDAAYRHKSIDILIYCNDQKVPVHLFW